MSSPSNSFSDHPKYSPYTTSEITYTTIHSTPLEATLLVPNTIKGKPGKYPLAIRWHGGFWITGHRLLPDWYPTWVLDFCLKHSAIVITPDYRLLPEANGADILEDLRTFYAWLLEPGNLASHLPEGVEADMENLLVTGESAGGWLAWQSALHQRSRTAAVIMHYPVIDLRDPHYTAAGPKQLFPGAPAELPPQILANYLSKLKGGEVVPNDPGTTRSPLVLSIAQQGRMPEFFGTERGLYPLEQVADGAVTSSLPPMWILHGRDDTAVPVSGTEKMVEALKGKGVGEKGLHVTIEAGDHGFDTHAPGTGEPASLETRWVEEGVAFIERSWPAPTRETVK
ncbi:hypothetical protein LTR62_004541 [Meristemomyces frigidus]|uniref:Alpha/beta hydrolase fold-3 domain-containing protein n=1 Tax=Meristemomyces frigidus TaxID=1508187 RepID=A0AAN7TDT1_9PEZI|nr:hypothetical protein LTR62_004541 [Meristemomyces frigidus]